MKKSLSAIFILVSFFLTGCGFNDEYTPPVNDVSRPPFSSASNTETSEEESLLEGIDSWDFSGDTFIIVTTDDKYLDSGNSDSILSSYIEKRNSAVEKKFNITIEIKVDTSENIVLNAWKAAENKEHYADLIIADGATLSKLMSKDVLYNLNELPYVDFDSDYVNSDYVNNATINGKLYLLYSDLTLADNSAWCVFYNKVLADDAGIDPISLYKSGEWTWDNFLVLSEAIAAETMNKTSPDKSADTFGFACPSGESEFVNSVWCSAGQLLFGDVTEAQLSIPVHENGANIVSFISDLISSASYFDLAGQQAKEKFISEELGMIVGNSEYAYELSGNNIEWLAVPMPKFSTQEDHYCYIDSSTMAVGVVKNTRNTEMTGRVLNGLLAASSKTMKTAVQKSDLYSYWRDNTHALAMHSLWGTGFLDIAFIYACDVKEIATVGPENLLQSAQTNIAPFSFYHSTKRTFETYAAQAFA